MPKPIREIRIEGNIAYVPLTQGYEAVIDAEDVPLVAGRNWHARGDRRNDGTLVAVYAVSRESLGRGRQGTIWMHRVIAATPEGLETDHIDGDGLNNRRCNIRPATKAQNQHNQRRNSRNTSGFKGVSWQRTSQQWHAYIRVNGARVHLGYFPTAQDAAAAYAKASAEMHGPFGRAG